MMSFIAKSSFSWKWKSDKTFSNNLQQKKDSERIAWSPSKEKLLIVKQILLTSAIENIWITVWGLSDHPDLYD